MSYNAAEGPTYRAAIVGTGRIGSTYDDEIGYVRDASYFRGARRHPGLYTVLPVNHRDALLAASGYRLVAAANRSKTKLLDFGGRAPGVGLYTDYQELLREERPDVVSVCTQSPEKAEIAIAAAESGARAVIVEKAMATSMVEADAMIEACRRHGTLLVVNHPNRFSPLNRRTREFIRDGAIGDLRIVSAFARGGMMHIGTHTFDMLRFWAGEVVEVDAYVPDYAPDKDLPAVGSLRFENGISGTFDHVQGALRGYEARGTSGYITVSSLVGDGWLYASKPMPDADEAGILGKAPDQLAIIPIEGEPLAMSLTRRLLDEVHEALTFGTPVESSGEEGARTLEVCLACYASHLAGEAVQLPLADRELRVPNR